MIALRIISLAGVTLAAVSVGDPSDVISPSIWAADNSLGVDYNVPFISVQPSDVVSAYTFDVNSTSIDHQAFSTTLNDTSVILVSDGAEVNLSYVDIEKTGYSSNLLLASFYGFNSAVYVVSVSPNSEELKQNPILILRRQMHQLFALTI